VSRFISLSYSSNHSLIDNLGLIQHPRNMANGIQNSKSSMHSLHRKTQSMPFIVGFNPAESPTIAFLSHATSNGFKWTSPSMKPKACSILNTTNTNMPRAAIVALVSMSRFSDYPLASLLNLAVLVVLQGMMWAHSNVETPLRAHHW
jgi:hypothetical protein